MNRSHLPHSQVSFAIWLGLFCHVRSLFSYKQVSFAIWLGLFCHVRSVFSYKQVSFCHMIRSLLAKRPPSSSRTRLPRVLCCDSSSRFALGCLMLHFVLRTGFDVTFAFLVLTSLVDLSVLFVWFLLFCLVFPYSGKPSAASQRAPSLPVNENTTRKAPWRHRTKLGSQSYCVC